MEGSLAVGVDVIRKYEIRNTRYEIKKYNNTITQPT
jgi:hypothetical protein